MTPSGIEQATFLFVAQRLNHCATAVPLQLVCLISKEMSFQGAVSEPDVSKYDCVLCPSAFFVVRVFTLAVEKKDNYKILVYEIQSGHERRYENHITGVLISP
jgi:hypothetical protein